MAAHDRLWFTWLYPQSWFPDLDCLSAVKHLGHPPLLLIHGTDDSAFPLSYARLLYDKATEQKKLVIVEGMKHNLGWSDLPRITKILYDFRKAL